jgi:ribosomal protein S18 acetylase RimI-like enzyme
MTYERLAWDSEFFGISIGRIPDDLTDRCQLARAVDAADADGIECLYFLLGLEELQAMHGALAIGFRPYDVRVELELELIRPQPPNTDRIRTARLQDVATLEELARATMEATRFAVDQRFPQTKVPDLYAAWVRRGVHAAPEHQAFIADPAAGFVVCGFDAFARVGSIELIGVAPKFGRRGIGGELLDAAHGAFGRAGFDHARVATQGRNQSAQRLYQARGYRTRKLSWWLHRWR